MLRAVVLAAGASTRMGTAKPLLTLFDGDPFVVRIVRTLVTAGLEDIVVVTRNADRAVGDALTAHGLRGAARLVPNPDPARGQLSSLLVGLDADLRPETQGLLVTLADVPMVLAATVAAVVDAWRVRRAPIVRPAMGGSHGHPVIFDRRLFDALRAAPMSEGAKRVVRDYEGAIENVPVDDPGCLRDIDTPDDYKSLIG